MSFAGMWPCGGISLIFYWRRKQKLKTTHACKPSENGTQLKVFVRKKDENKFTHPNQKSLSQ